MRNLRSILVAGIVLAACSDRQTGPITSPTGETPGPLVTAPISSPYCTAKTDTEIIDDIEELYFKNQWPDPNSATSKFNQVLAALDAQPADVDGARLATKNLVDFVKNKYDHLANPTEEQTTLYNQLIDDLWCFVGISGEVFDLNPGDPPKTFKLPGVGGVWFPGDVVPTGTLVALTNISDGPAPLNTFLDQFASYIDIKLYPAHTFSPGNLPVVVICPEDGTPDDVVLGHNSPLNGFELLDPDIDIPPELASVCTETTGQNGANQGWLAHWANRAVSLLLPQRLQASMLFSGGIGGSPLDFSPFGAVSTTLTGTDGLGGSATEFAPRAQPGAAATSPADGILDGIVGSIGDPQDGDWPVVTVKTLGRDGLANPVPGVTVTFTIGAATTLDPDSEAQLCDLNGTVQTTVSDTTDANGVASLPCLKFGTKAGYANVQATFDTDDETMGFSGADLLVVQSSVGQSSSSSLNWLVQSVAGPAATILTSMPPAADIADYTYPGFVAFNVPISPVPRAIVKDQYGNAVENGTVTWTPVNSMVNAGSTAVNTLTDANGFATVSSWTPGPGEATLLASVAGVANPATFTALSSIGAAAFLCELGAAPYDLEFMTVGGNINKIDLAPIKVKDPKTNVFDLFLYMSVTGQSNTFASYNVDLKVYRTAGNATSPGTTQVGAATGATIGLPGNNGKPQLQHIKLTSPVSAVTSGNNALWFVLSVLNPPGGRTFQAWFTNVANNKQSDACKSTSIGTGNSPKVGVAVLLKN